MSGHGRGVKADRSGGSKVKALGPAVDRHRDRLVGERGEAGRQAPGLVAEQPGGARLSWPVAARSSSRDRAAPSAASSRRPAARRPDAACASGTPAVTGTWNRLPAADRTHLPLYGSTLAAAKMTPPAPAASAVRSTVPALPGSRTFASTATSRGRAAVRSASGTSTKLQTASRPWGCTVWVSAAMTSAADQMHARAGGRGLAGQVAVAGCRLAGDVQLVAPFRAGPAPRAPTAAPRPGRRAAAPGQSAVPASGPRLHPRGPDAGDLTRRDLTRRSDS